MCQFVSATTPPRWRRIGDRSLLDAEAFELLISCLPGMRSWGSGPTIVGGSTNDGSVGVPCIRRGPHHWSIRNCISRRNYRRPRDGSQVDLCYSVRRSLAVVSVIGATTWTAVPRTPSARLRSVGNISSLLTAPVRSPFALSRISIDPTDPDGSVELPLGPDGEMIDLPTYAGDGTGQLTFTEPMITEAFMRDVAASTDGEVTTPVPLPSAFPEARPGITRRATRLATSAGPTPTPSRLRTSSGSTPTRPDPDTVSQRPPASRVRSSVAIPLGTSIPRSERGVVHPTSTFSTLSGRSWHMHRLLRCGASSLGSTTGTYLRGIHLTVVAESASGFRTHR